MPLRHSIVRARRALGLPLAVLLMSCWGPESPSQKAEYAFLQQVEYEYRAAGPDPRCRIKKSTDDRYCAAGFWSEEANQRVWVLVRPESEPLKVLPSKPFSVLPEEIDLLIRECSLTSLAADLLRQRVERPQ